MRRFLIALAAAILALALAPGFSKATTIVTSSPYPYQRWADESVVPVAPGPLVVEDVSWEGACGGQGLACTGPGQPIQMGHMPEEGWREARETFRHELGHRFDYEVMTDWARARFEALIGDYRPWVPAINEAQPNAPREKFAEAWMRCSYSLTIKRAPQTYGYDYRPTPKLQAKVCRMIQRVGAEAGV